MVARAHWGGAGRFWALLLLLGARLEVCCAAANEAAALLALPAAVSNWDAATAALPGSAWQASSSPCGDGGGQAAWRGVTCSSDGQVTAIQLSGLGLEGTLPASLAGLPALQLLDVSRNRFRGPLPAGWSSSTLAQLNVSVNNLTGSLPPSWGGEALPALSALELQGNRLEGMVPMPQWTDVGFASPLILYPLPANQGLCGPVMPVNPDLFPAGNPEQNQPLIPYCNQMRTGDNMTHIILTQRDLFTPGTEVTITNWLGSCATPCSQAPGGLAQPPAGVAQAGLPWPPTVRTNVYDLSWAYNMTMSDLVDLNPNAYQLQPGDSLVAPCYPDTGLSRFGWYGGCVSFGQFSGGNQRLGSAGLPGAMAAARVNGGLPYQFHVPSVYEGNQLADGNGTSASSQLLEPVYWFVDLLAQYHVTNVLVTAGGATRNAAVYVGSNTTSVLANTRVASNLNLAAGQQVAVPGGATLGRYVIIYTGSSQEGTLSLDDVQVYTYESNAAAFKPATASGAAAPGRAGSSPQGLQALVDNNASSCVLLEAAPQDGGSPGTWATVDLGYLGPVGSVAIRAGSSLSAGVSSRVYVTRGPNDARTDAVSCTLDARALQAGNWTTTTCKQTGRYVTLVLPNFDPATGSADICELQVALAAAPSNDTGGGGGGGGSSSSGGLSGGAIAGIVIGSLAGAALLVLLGAYLRWRHRWVAQQRRQVAAVAEVEEKEKEDKGGGAHGLVDVQGYGDGDEEEGQAGGPDGGGNGAAGMAVSPAGVLVTGAGKPVAPVGGGGGGGWDKPVPMKLSELQLLGRFFTSLRHGGTLPSLSQRSSHESSSRRTPFGMAKGGAGAADHAHATTDLTKLPPGFLEVSPADIKLVECVGEGSFGEVWLAEYCGALVAVKILAKVKSDFMTHSMQQQLALRNLQKEALLMSKLRHPNVCLYLGAVTNPPCLVMEYCAKCSLDHLLRAGLGNSQMAKRLSWVRLLSMALDAAKGMLYLHSRQPPIAHRDLKSANLLVDSQWRVKVADFSLSRALEIGSTAYTVVSTNPRWLAPEVLSGHPGQLPADVWAFGTVLWEMCTWRLPFEELNTFQIINKVQSQGGAGLVVPRPEELAAGPFSCYPQYVALMRACWSLEPEQRPTFAFIKEELADMLTAEMIPLQQAAAAAAAAAAAQAAAAAGAGGPRVGPQPAGADGGHRSHSSKSRSGSSSGRGGFLRNSLGLSTSPPTSGRHTSGGPTTSGSQGGSHGRGA